MKRQANSTGPGFVHLQMNHPFLHAFSTAFTAPGYDHTWAEQQFAAAHQASRTGALHDIHYPGLFVNRPWGMSDDEYEDARAGHHQRLKDFHDTVRHEVGEPDLGDWDARDRWEGGMRRALTKGLLNLDDAKQRGYRGDAREMGDEYTGRGGWQKLPSKVYHVGTDADAIEREGLKTRAEQGGRVTGLGGGGHRDQDQVSVTSDPKLPADIYHSLHEHHAVIHGHITPDHLLAYAEHPPAAQKPFRKEFEQALSPHMLDRAREGDVGYRSEVYKAFSNARHWSGGHRDPLYLGNDPRAFAETDPAKFGILHLRPHPEAQGYPLQGDGGHHSGADSGEWRLGSGSPFDVEKVDKPTPRHLGEFGLPQREASYETGPDGVRRSSSDRAWNVLMGRDPHDDGSAPARPAPRPVKHQVEDIDHRTYTVRDVDRANAEGGLDTALELEGHKHEPQKATFRLQRVPIDSLRIHRFQGDRVVKGKPFTTDEMIGHGEDYDEAEAERVHSIRQGGGSVPPILVVKDGPHHLIRDGSHRVGVAMEEGETHIPAFVTDHEPGVGRAWSEKVGGATPPAERHESVQHMLRHYAPTDFDTWDEVRNNTNWDHPSVRSFVDDVRRNGVRRPIPVDYESTPPQVMNGHTRLLAAERAGVTSVPTRQHEGWMDPDDPDHLGRGPDDPEHWTNKQASLSDYRLDDEARVSVAEHAMERGGLAGRTIDVPKATRANSPEGVEPYQHQRTLSREAEDYLHGVLRGAGHTGEHLPQVNPAHWDLRQPGSGVAMLDGYNNVCLAGEHANEMTLLHEAAHYLTRTNEGPGGHGQPFQQAAHDLYHRHLGPEAAKTFRDILEPSGSAKLAVQAPPEGLYFTHDEMQTGGSKYPTRIHLRAHTPEDGQVGALIYHPPRRRNGIVSVYNMHVEPEHRRRGIASALMDEMQRRHPDSSIDHGDRTWDGEDWWKGYTDGQKVQRGRTAPRQHNRALHRGVLLTADVSDLAAAHEKGGMPAVHEHLAGLVGQHQEQIGRQAPGAPGVGTHWTTDPKIAHQFSQGHYFAGDRESVPPTRSPYNGEVHIPVMMSGKVAPEHQVTDRDELRGAMVEGHGYESVPGKRPPEKETLVRKGAPVQVTGMRAALPTHPDWVHQMAAAHDTWQHESWGDQEHVWQSIGGMGRHTAASDDDYRVPHTAPDADDYSAPLHDLRPMYGDDFYEHPEYHRRGTTGEDEALYQAQRVRDRPDAKVKIYRALPAEHVHHGFRPGDWVSTSAEYAREHGRETHPDNDWPVIRTTVRADQLRNVGDITEYGYHGPHKPTAMVHFKGGKNQEVRQHADGIVRKVVRRPRPPALGNGPEQEDTGGHGPYEASHRPQAGRGGRDRASGRPGVAGPEGAQGDAGAVPGGSSQLREVSWHPQALKDLRKLDGQDQKRIRSTVEGLQRGDENLRSQTHLLRAPLVGWRSTKASRGHRIIHTDLDDGSLHVGYVGLHEYGDAERRLGTLIGWHDGVPVVDHRTEQLSLLGSRTPLTWDEEQYMPRQRAPRQSRPQQDWGVFWHGTPSGDLRGARNGLHIGSQEAARQALHARIGFRADGKDWDGTQEYGKTLLAGKKNLLARERGRYLLTGHNAFDLPEEDHYAHERDRVPTFGNTHDGDKMQSHYKPDLFPVRITGEMSNTPRDPHPDFKANGYMQAQLKRGTARRGYFYTNEGEDSGSISAVVPNGDHIERLPHQHTAELDRDGSWILYHGTSGENAESIAEHGFQHGQETNGQHSGTGFYFHEHPRDAAQYGDHVVVVQAEPRDFSFHHNPWADPDVDHSRVSESLQEQHYDGHRDPDDGAVVLYRPHQIHYLTHMPAKELTGRTAKLDLHLVRVLNPTSGHDPDLFDGEHLKPEVRRELVHRWTVFCATHGLANWHAYVSLYFTGGEASEWSGPGSNPNGDFDMQVGLDFDEFRAVNTQFAGQSDEAISFALNAMFWIALNDHDFHPAGSPRVFDLTWYSNPAVNPDIAHIRPYAAYNLLTDEWAVHPKHYVQAPHLPKGVRTALEGADRYARQILALPEPQRTREAAALFESWHNDRNAAFGPGGLGVFDYANLRMKALEATGVWQQLQDAANRLPKAAKLPKTQKCEYCTQQATQRIIHAEGMAYVPVCDDHVQKAIDDVGEDEVCGKPRPIAKAAAEEWRYQHRPAGPPRPEDYYEGGQPAHDLNFNRHSDAYDGSPSRRLRTLFDHPDTKVVRTLMQARGNPERPITIYRALPAEHADKGFQTGDWVSPSRAYAQSHARSNGGMAVIKATVPAKHVWFAGDYNEAGYHGEPIPGEIHTPGRAPKQAAAEDYEYRHAQPDSKEVHWVSAHDPRTGERVGDMTWHAQGPSHHVTWISVYDQENRRKGIATGMWNKAREVDPQVIHNPDVEEGRTRAGHAWAQTTASASALPPGYSMQVREDPKTERWGLPALHVDVHHNEGRKPVGSLSVHQRVADGGGTKGHPNIYVDPEHQRAGLATAMYAEVHRRWPDVPIEHSEHASDDARALNQALTGRFPGMHRQAAMDGTDYEGTVGNRNHITRVERGMLPIDAVRHMRGARGEVPGEHRNHQGEAWESFKADVAANGVKEPIFITVDHGRDPELSEGSHRRDAAVELNHPGIPAEIRYYGHAEQQGTVEQRAMRRQASVFDDEEECAECGGDHPTHEHDDHDDTHRSDWDAHWPGITDLHRGIHVNLSPETHAIVHDHSRPIAERAHTLMKLMQQGHHGMHWTSDPEQAEHYATSGYSRYDRDSTPVRISGTKPHRDWVETDDDTLRDHRVIGYDYHDDQEVPLQRHAPVQIHSISWGDHDGDKLIYHHRFDQPHKVIAKLAAVELRYTRNNGGMRQHAGPEDFDQHIEPWGRYYNQHEGYVPEGWESGTVRFENPLHMDWDDGEWKRKLSEQHGGRTGKELSQALLARGHDAVITHDRELGPMEFVDVRPKEQRDHVPDGETTAARG